MLNIDDITKNQLKEKANKWKILKKIQKNILKIKYYFIISKDIKSIKTIIKSIILINLYSELLKSKFFLF